MRLTNKYRIPYIKFLYTLIELGLGLCLIAYFFEIQRFDVFGDYSWVLAVVPILIFVLLIRLGRPFFEYDSDGEALVFRNSHIMPIFGKELRDEFPKYKLVKYNFVKVIFYKKLYIYISSKKNNVVILKYDVSFLSSKEIKDLKYSLNKTTKANLEYTKNNKIEDN